jgi:hypothetical protein
MVKTYILTLIASFILSAILPVHGYKLLADLFNSYALLSFILMGLIAIFGGLFVPTKKQLVLS